MKKLFFVLFVFLVIGAGVGGTYFFYIKYQDAKFKLDNPDIVAQDEVKRITEKLSQFIELPAGEEPSVATVLEKDKLADQPFFARSENGDKVVIYTKAAKAILYRESTNKIIEVAPINLTQAEETSSPEFTPTPTPKPSKDAEPTESATE